jgi:FkbM family methyltransferase
MTLLSVKNEVIMDFVSSFGVKIPIDRDVISEKLERKLKNNNYEAPEVRGLANFVKKQDRILELGAGIGFISTYLSKIFGVKGVLAYEANPDMLPYIEKVHRANGVENVEVRNQLLLNDTAVANASIPFYITDPLHSSSMVKPDATITRVADVPTARLSDAIAEFDPTIIVCDIEGAEAEIFEAVNFGNVKRVYAESHRRKYGGLGMRKFVHDMHRHDFFLNARYSVDGQVLFNRLPKRQWGQFEG